MVRLDGGWIVEIIDHDPVGFLQSPLAGIAHPVDPLQPGAIAQMEACDRIGAVFSFAADRTDIPRKGATKSGGRHARVAVIFVQDSLLSTARRVARTFSGSYGIPVAANKAFASSSERLRFRTSLALQPAAEAGYRREGGELPQARQFRTQFLDHLLDQKIAEGDAAQPILAI